MALEQIIPAATANAAPARRPLGVLVFVPLLIAMVGLGAIVLGLMPMSRTVHTPSGYGVDEFVTGSIAAKPAQNPIILLDR